MVQKTWLFLPMSKFYEGSGFGDRNLFCLFFFVWFGFGFLLIFGFSSMFFGGCWVLPAHQIICLQWTYTAEQLILKTGNCMHCFLVLLLLIVSAYNLGNLRTEKVIRIQMCWSSQLGFVLKSLRNSGRIPLCIL